MRTSRCGMFLTIDRVILHSLQIGYSLNITFFKLSLKGRANVFRVFTVFTVQVNIYIIFNIPCLNE